MPTTVNLRKLLDRKSWEALTPVPVTSGAGSFVISSTLTNRQMFVAGVSAVYLNDPTEDATLQIPNSGLTGTFGAGSCGVHHPYGPSSTALSGSTATTLNTNLNMIADVGSSGFVVRLTGGTGAGQERTVTRTTISTTSVFTVSAPWTVTPDATTTFTLMSGRFWVWNAGTTSTFGFRYYDTATNTWSAELAKPSVGATWATDGRLVSAETGVLDSGTATAGAASTLTDSAKTWATNTWATMQVRITSGTGAGQIRTVASNTATVLTTATAFTVAPDASSSYVLEGNDDHLYLLGNAAVALYRYSISTNTWTTLSPTAARAAVPGVGMFAGIVKNSSDPAFTGGGLSGKRIFSLRGGASGALDYYDIPANTWVSTVPYLRSNETFTTGSAYALVDDQLYIQKDVTGRWFRLDLARMRLDPWSTLIYPQGAAVIGDRAFDTVYTDGGTTLRWINFWMNTGTPVFRCLII